MEEKKDYYVTYRVNGKIERIPVTKEYHDVHYHQITNYRVRQMKLGQCCCPKKHFRECDMDCWTCDYRVQGAELSLDSLICPQKGEVALADLLQDLGETLEEQMERNELECALYDAIDSLDDPYQEVVQFSLDGASARSCAKHLEIARKRVNPLFEEACARLKEKLVASGYCG